MQEILTYKHVSFCIFLNINILLIKNKIMHTFNISISYIYFLLKIERFGIFKISYYNTKLNSRCACNHLKFTYIYILQLHALTHLNLIFFNLRLLRHWFPFNKHTDEPYIYFTNMPSIFFI